MDGNDFIKLAGKLAAMPAADEASCRTSVSRAYYGAFHLAKALLESLGFAAPANVNVHGFVRHHLNGSRVADACRAARHLADLQAARNKADYQFGDPHVGQPAYAATVVEKAHDIRSALAACSAHENRETLKAAITDYLNKLAAP